MSDSILQRYGRNIGGGKYIAQPSSDGPFANYDEAVKAIKERDNKIAKLEARISELTKPKKEAIKTVKPKTTKPTKFKKTKKSKK